MTDQQTRRAERTDADQAREEERDRDQQAAADRRPTRQRTAIASALTGAAEFRSAQEIHADLAGSGTRVGLATVYRNLQAMAADGEVDVIRTPDGEAVYRSCSTHHHHHVVCRSCGLAVEVTGDAVERWADAVARAHGFTQVRHTVEMDGLCADCSAAARG